MFWTSEYFQVYATSVYALSYFVLFGVIFYYTLKGVHIDLVDSFRLFGWFAFLHGIADTLSIFCSGPLRQSIVFCYLRTGFDFASVALLMAFCVKILVRDDEVRVHLNKYFYLVYAASAAFVLILLMFEQPSEVTVFIAVYFGFPVFMMTGAAFFLLARHSRTVIIKRLHFAFNGIALCFAVFALLKAVRGSVDGETAVAVIRILRTATALSLAGFTAVGLSRLKATARPLEAVPASPRALSVLRQGLRKGGQGGD